MVELDEFITKTLKDIQNGVTKAREGKSAYSIRDNPIEFDLSVSISEQAKGDVKAKILVLSSEIEGNTINVNSQRVRFKVFSYEHYDEDPTGI